MNVSVVVTTYNQPEWLKKVIWGYAAQTHRQFELVIADDGSGDETRSVIDQMRASVDFEIQHIWHEDVGFRKCTILNKAIAACRSEYLVFTDGDCIPRNDFLSEHVRLGKKNHFLSGGCVRLPMAVSRLISREDIQSGRVTNVSWLRQNGLPISKKLRLLTKNTALAYVLDTVSTTLPSFNGHNASAWKSDIVRVNGFNETMQYGGLDREIGERLVNAQVSGIRIRHRAVCVHLDHARPYRDIELFRQNTKVRKHIVRSGLSWTPEGLDKHLGEHELPVESQSRQSA